MSEDEGKKIELSKRVYSLIRDLRVLKIWRTVFSFRQDIADFHYEHGQK